MPCAPYELGSTAGWLPYGLEDGIGAVGIDDGSVGADTRVLLLLTT